MEKSYDELVKEKIAWGKTLKPGDLICDCRFKHVAIKEIWWDGKFDYTILTEDGMYCSLIHCADKADHDESVHEQQK